MAPHDTSTPVLELADEEQQRPFLTRHGERYHFKVRTDLSLAETISVMQVGKRFQQLGDRDIVEMSSDEARQLEEDIDYACRLVMFDMPDDVHKRLKVTERARIIEAFGKVLDDGAAASRPAPENSSPESAASTT